LLIGIPDLELTRRNEQIEMLANFSDYSADYPKLSFEEIAKKLGGVIRPSAFE
jgi:hypothetical protein